MADTKYGEYLTTECVHKHPRIEGAYISSTRNLESFGGKHLSVDCIYVTYPHEMITQPHKHEFPQYLHFYSANADNGIDFDAEIELTLGEEREKHIITSPTAVYIPAGLDHGPLFFKTINKPVLFIDCAVTGTYSRVGDTPD